MKTAIICGSGVAGLSAAIALASTGWSVDVYERDGAVREIGAGIFIKGNGLRVLDSFGLLETIRRDSVVLQQARTLDRDGTLLQRRVLQEANPVWNIQRQRLLRALLERATDLGARVYTSSPVEAVNAAGTIVVRGEQRKADLVIAADGVHSVARQCLGLDRPVRAPLSGAIRLLIPRSIHESEDVVREYWSGRLRIGIAPCTRDEVFCYLIAPLDETRGARLPVHVAHWSAHFPKLASEGFFDRLAASAAVHHRYPLVGTSSWVKGRVVLAGDAAHAQPPTLGQGAGLSLTNMLLLSRYLSSIADVDDALAAWQHDWRWISDRTQTWARRYDWITSEWPRSVYPLRSAVIWAIGKSRRFNSYMRVADRVDAPRGIVLPPLPGAPSPKRIAPARA